MQNKMEGWLKIHRKITEWEWYQDHNTKMLFFHLILTCNFKPTKWRGISLKIGESIKSIETLAEELNLSEQNIRTAIKHLTLTGELTERQHGRHRILKLKNYESYQITNTDTNTLLTGFQQDANRMLTADKECKNEKNDKNEKNIYGDQFQKLNYTDKGIMFNRINEYSKKFAEAPSEKQINHWIETELNN